MCFLYFLYTLHFVLFTVHFTSCATKDTWPGFQELHFANFGTFWLRRRPYFHTCLLSWLERPNSSNSLPPTTGKFGRNSLLRTIFKFLRLLSSTGRNTQWWPQHQPLVSREFCFSQILLNIYKIEYKILWEIEFCTAKSLPQRLLFHGELEIPCKKFPALAMLRKIRQKICLRQDLNIMQLWRQ